MMTSETTSTEAKILCANVLHARRGRVNNRFNYGLLMIDAQVFPGCSASQSLLGIDKRAPLQLRAQDHGQSRGKAGGQASITAIAADLLRQANAPIERVTSVRLLTQPSIFGFVFNPVSFWQVFDGPQLIAVIAEVNNTFGDRHFYLCANEDWSPIKTRKTINVRKVFHVSPFQPIDGQYAFSFERDEHRLAFTINYQSEHDDGVFTRISGPLHSTKGAGAIWRFMTAPISIARVLGLIYWQAIKIKLRGGQYRPHPAPPQSEMST